MRSYRRRRWISPPKQCVCRSSQQIAANGSSLTPYSHSSSNDEVWSLGSIRVVQAKRVIMFNVPTENMCEGQRWPSVLCCRWIRCSVYAQTVFKSVSLAQPCGQENESFENRYRRWLYASGFLDIVSDHELLHMTHKEKQRNHSARQTMEAFF